MMVVDFRYSTSGLLVKFTNLSKEVPEGLSYFWDFGDGETSTDLNPVHLYTDSGFYVVTLSLKTIEENTIASRSVEIGVTNQVKTTLPDSIYNLIDNYIPQDIFGYIPYNQKRNLIVKWQLYIQPLVNHVIPVEEYSNEMYYEALENQLIMELAAYDFMIISISNTLKATSQLVKKNSTQSSSSSSTDVSVEDNGGKVKKIVTGPTEVEYFDNSEKDSETVANVIKAMQPGGIIDIVKQNLCMLALRLDIYLPICNRTNGNVVVPEVVNPRDPGLLGGPDPLSIIK